MSPSGLCRATRKRFGVSSEISDQVGRRSYQLPKIVLSGYRRATGGSVECRGYPCLRSDSRNRSMYAWLRAFCNRDRTICLPTVHR
jgi:hypothetical protein